MGPRRIGKTVMVLQAIKQLIDDGVSPKSILYLSLDTPVYTGLNLESALNLFKSEFQHSRSHQLFIFFDEIQYLKDWEIHLKSLVDTYKKIKFIATGSAAAALKLKSNESGAGRFTDFLLPPLTFHEYLEFSKKDYLIDTELFQKGENSRGFYSSTNIEALNEEFVNYLNYGGYPEALFSSAVRSAPERFIRSDIIDKVLLRDLPSLYGISDIQELNRLFTTLAYNTAHEVSLDSLSKNSGVSKNTLKRYLEYLEAAFLIRRVNRVDQNCKKFKRANFFKIYLTNPSMRAALFGRVDKDHSAIGDLAESAIYAQWLHSETISQLYYGRWSSGEIDLVYLIEETQRAAWFVEVKWSNSPLTKREKTLANSVFFASKHQSEDYAAITVTTKSVTESFEHHGYNFELVPTAAYAYTVGKNVVINRRAGKNF